MALKNESSTALNYGFLSIEFVPLNYGFLSIEVAQLLVRDRGTHLKDAVTRKLSRLT